MLDERKKILLENSKNLSLQSLDIENVCAREILTDIMQKNENQV